MVEFALCIVRCPFKESLQFGKYLAVNETRDRGWWIPGGGVDKGETFSMAAKRECMEEANMDIELKGVLKIEHKASNNSKYKMRVIFYAEPVSLEATNAFKTEPDSESNEARWVTQ